MGTFTIVQPRGFGAAEMPIFEPIPVYFGYIYEDFSFMIQSLIIRFVILFTTEPVRSLREDEIERIAAEEIRC
jgi:hypothetical protein